MFNRCPSLILAAVMLTWMMPKGIAQQVGKLPQHANQPPQGVLAPWKICRVAFAESGLIDQLWVTPGDNVQAGQKLASLEVQQQLILVQMAQVQAEAVGKVASVRAEVELNRRKLQSIEAGRTKDFSTKSELDRAQIELRIAEGRLANELDQARIEQLNLHKLQTQLEQRTVVAPFTGTVVRILKEVGEYIAPTSPEVMELVDTSKLRATFFLNTDEVRRLRSNERPLITVDENNNLPAVLEYVAPLADSEAGLIEVRLLIANPNREVLGSICRLMLGPTDSLPRSSF